MSQERISRAAEAIRNSDAKTRQFMKSSKGTFLGIFYGAVKRAIPNLDEKAIHNVVASALDEVYGKGRWERFTDNAGKTKVRVVPQKKSEPPAKAAESPPDNVVTFARLPDNGGWGLRGPKSMMIEGEKVTVTKKDGSVAEATVGEFVRDESGDSSLHRKK